MPTYSFTCESCGRTQEVFRSVAERNSPLLCGCNKTMTRDFACTQEEELLAAKPGLGARRIGLRTYPRKSDAMGVHPSQVKEAQDYMKSVGVPTEFTKDGRPVLRTKGHEKAHAEARGFFQRNGGYSCPQRK